MEKDLNIFKRRTCVLKHQMYLAISLDVYISKHIFVKHSRIICITSNNISMVYTCKQTTALDHEHEKSLNYYKKMFSMFVFLERKFL